MSFNREALFKVPPFTLDARNFQVERHLSAQLQSLSMLAKIASSGCGIRALLSALEEKEKKLVVINTLIFTPTPFLVPIRNSSLHIFPSLSISRQSSTLLCNASRSAWRRKFRQVKSRDSLLFTFLMALGFKFTQATRDACNFPLFPSGARGSAEALYAGSTVREVSFQFLGNVWVIYVYRAHCIPSPAFSVVCPFEFWQAASIIACCWKRRSMT